jgi:hypothetical protein
VNAVIALQYDFFKSPEQCEIEALRKEIEKVRISSDKVRRGIYARHGALEKKYDQLIWEFEQLKQAICKN